ncbi:MAG TPA: GNAT family N-acetyltransferase [Pyrinomonadaceae bacterium]|jgi:predicted GNAT superfamily acetyltransferase
MINFLEIEGQPAPETVEKLEALYASVFGDEELDRFAERLAAADNPLTVLALRGDKPVGFKIGYRLAPKKFYSWIGGVTEGFRYHGIAAELMRRQHAWCTAKRFETIQTKTMNRFKSMLILNLKNGFDITEVYRDERGEIKIVLEKNLRG